MEGGKRVGKKRVSQAEDSRVLNVLGTVIDSLTGTRVPYMVIGAWALAVWGKPRATMDLDFMVMVDEMGLGRIEAHLVQERFTSDRTWLEWNPMLKESQLRMHFRGGTVDLMRPRDSQDIEAFERRKKKRVAGRFCWFIAPEDFILQKLKVGRPRDFEDALSVLERSRKILDLTYLGRWTQELDLTEELGYLLGE